MKSSFKICFLIFIFLLFSTYNTKQNKESVSIFFPIKEILIEDNLTIKSLKLKTDLNFLMGKSLFFLDEERIFNIINRYEFISNIRLKKIYPNNLKVIIIEEIPVATQIIDQKKFYITKDNKKLNYIDIKIYENLPSIFGKYKNFNIFYDSLKKNDFDVDKIKSFYYFDIGRWDIVLKNEKVIKFPEKNYTDLLPKINSMLNDNIFFKYNTFDFRIKNQLILQ
jgi:cell division septal protein FtsQ